ncbi:MAG TPA: protein-glutamate O-methyltransferase CheR [Gemmatirosa sp.]|jgi:chemotaxis protein methyltransferase CheR|nr:protein-glutamate O-methyltransferase CheR [Gemmatirosa sp.]
MTLPVAPLTYDPALERLEIELLLEALHRHYGHDFRGYAYASLRRRIWKRLAEERLDTITALTDRVLHDATALDRLVDGLSVNVTAMFRDPAFWHGFRERVVPLLRTYPFFRIWHAGCSTGEEVYSMAILLEEEGLYERARLYATDMNERVLRTARAGIFPLDRMQEYTDNYLRAGGRQAFSGYYVSGYDGALFDQRLLRHVVFAQHNLVTDRSFSEFHAILCRNVLIYFDRALQTHAHRLFYDSLATFGVLALGSKETLRFSPFDECFEPLAGAEKMYRKVR